MPVLCRLTLCTNLFWDGAEKGRLAGQLVTWPGYDLYSNTATPELLGRRESCCGSLMLA